MAKLNIILLVHLIIILCYAIVKCNAQLQQQIVSNGGKRQQRPRPMSQSIDGLVNGFEGNIHIQKNKNQKPHRKPMLNKPKLFTKSIENLGRLRGRIIKSDFSGKSIFQFLDIPYGKSPVGPLRFKPSVPAEAWQGVLPAHRLHSGCPSLQEFDKFATLMEHNVDIEDCLRLTVNTKSLDGNAPVMVYIHGDFLYDGDSSEAAPGYLLEQNIVLVSVRYRLGPFGFLSTMSDDIPGNAAVHDVILSLKWIQKHIASFGGDPKRVTLFGQVGGSALINVLTLSPIVPADLFHQVIYHSGSALTPTFITNAPLDATKNIARIAGCKNVNKIESLNKCLRKLNTTALLNAFSLHGESKSFLGIGPYGGVQLVIGEPSGVLPEHPSKLLSSGKFRAYPTLGGSAKHVGSFLLKDIFIDSFNETILDNQMSGSDYIDFVIEQINGVDVTGTWKKFAKQEIFSATDIANGTFKRLIPGLIDLCSTITFKNPVMLVMQANFKKLPNSTYLFSFDYEGEINRYASAEDEAFESPFDFGVSLTDDNLYLFPWPRFHILNSNRDIKMAKRMVELWTSFAESGVPKAASVPVWPSMSDEAGQYMKIDRTVSFGNNYFEEFNVAVRESKLGYNLVNDEYFENLASENGGNVASNHEDKDGADDFDAKSLRRSNFVFITKQSSK